MSECLPGLWFAKVQEVDAVQIHVLRVPGEGTFPHAKVQVGSVDPFDLDPALVLDGVQDGVQTADVPLSHILQRRRNGHTGARGPLRSGK